MMDFIERLRAKPDHTRKQIALGAATGFTGLVALVWLTAFTASGALARPSESKESGVTSAFSEQSGASLLGAVGALTARQDGSITVVGTRASSTMQADAAPEERTVIPF